MVVPGPLTGHRASQVRSANCATVFANLVDEHMLGSGQHYFLFNLGNNTVGLMTLHRINQVPRPNWKMTSSGHDLHGAIKIHRA